MKKVMSAVLALLLISTSARADDSYLSPLKQGQPAPYDGLLLNPTAAATIMSDRRLQQDLIKAEVDKAVGEVTANFTFKMKEQDINFREKSAVLESQLKIRDGAIRGLEEEIKRSKDAAKWTPLYVAGGVVGGIAATILGGWAYIQVTK